jgi:TolB-like protein
VSSRGIIAAAVAGVVILAAATAAWIGSRRSSVQPVRSVVVLPFANLSGDSGKEYFSDGLTEEITDSAAGVPGLRVVARTTAFQYKGKGKDVRQIGEELHADAVLEGSVRWDQNRLRITAQLNTTKDGYHLWSRTWDRELKDVFTVQQEIAQSVVDSLTRRTGPLPRGRRPTGSLEAYQLYLEGRFLRQKVDGGSLKRAIALLERAIALDPNFAAAYAMLSDCYLDLGYTSQWPPKAAYPKAAQAASRAIDIDDTLSYSHSVMGLIRLYFDWDWKAAEPELRRAIELDPEDANAYHYYSHYFVSASRFRESLNMSKQALDLDPVAARLLGHRTWNQSWARNLSEAIEVGQKEVDLHPEAGVCCGNYLVWAYEQAKDYQKAIDAREQFGFAKDVTTQLSLALNQHGPDGYWQALLKRNLSNTGYVGSYFRARLYASANQAEEAFHWLNQAIEQRDSWLVYLKVDPALDSLRSDARFPDLVRRVGIPE